jgi:hypothetical protein
MLTPDESFPSWIELLDTQVVTAELESQFWSQTTPRPWFYTSDILLARKIHHCEDSQEALGLDKPRPAGVQLYGLDNASDELGSGSSGRAPLMYKESSN